MELCDQTKIETKIKLGKEIIQTWFNLIITSLFLLIRP